MSDIILSVQEQIFSIETYVETTSFIAVQVCFHRQFQCHRYLDKGHIHRWVQKFRERMTVVNSNAKGSRDSYSGQLRSDGSSMNIDAINSRFVQTVL